MKRQIFFLAILFGAIIPTRGYGLKIKRVFSGGDDNNCVMFDNKRIKCWGNNNFGNLGLSDPYNRGGLPNQMGNSLPFVNLGSVPSLSKLAVHDHSACALFENSRVKCWGRNLNGELGLEATAFAIGWRPEDMGDHLPYLNLGTIGAVVNLEAGYLRNCAIFDNGRAKCWGKNDVGQLALGDLTDRGSNPGDMGDHLPFIDLGNVPAIKQLALGYFFSCALFENGKVKCWGTGKEGELGTADDQTTALGQSPETLGDHIPYVDFGDTGPVVQITAGGSHACAIFTSGRIKCWGANFHGDLGLGDTLSRGFAAGSMGNHLPFVELGTSAPVTQVIAGVAHTCARIADGLVKCWGGNFAGALGLGDLNSRGDEPNEMGNQLPYVDLEIAVVQISVGYAQNCALLANGALKCWGDNTYGQLGLGDTFNRGESPNQMGPFLEFIDLGN